MENYILIEDFEIIDMGIQEIDVYDIEVDNVHNFFANDILVHNSNYLSLDDIVEKFIKPNLEDENDFSKIADMLDKFSDGKITPTINAACDNIASYTNSLKQLMNFKREAISDIGIWCCHPDTIVNGVKITEFWDNATPAGEAGIREFNYGITFYSVDSNQSATENNCDWVYRRYVNEEMYCIVTEHTTLKLTGNHEVAVSVNNELVWVQAKDLTTSHKLYVRDTEILEIYTEFYSGYVYDLGMRGDTNFFANGILIHNCAKKRYALNVIDNEGVRYAVPKVKVMGLEIVRSSTPALIRTLLKEAVTISLRGTEKELQDFCAKAKKEFNAAPVDQIAYPRGVNGMVRYSSTTNIYAKGEGVSCPIHVRAALLYNHYVKTKGLDEKYPYIEDGDKLKYVNLKMPNPIRENVIAFADKFPVEIVDPKYIDYATMWDKAFEEPLKKVIGSFGWHSKKQASLAGLFSQVDEDDE